MKKVDLLLVGLLLCVSLSVLAGEVLTNDTGADATGLRVTFSSPVLITEFGDILTSVDPQMLAFDFVFSGGVVEPWGSHWMNWAPATASIMEVEWMTGAFPTSTSQSSGLSREALLNLGRAPTYDEIMGAIAEYPGPDEPLYEPRSDEAIWLTDLEGHADIYDNDSIKINYAAWFDQSQITKIEVYRNGIKLRFIPDRIGVLTNEQMKKFDGNPLENTPASSHTDHAIAGYEYRIAVRTQASAFEVQTKILALFSYAPKYRMANLPDWEDRINGASDATITRALEDLKEQNWNGIQLDYWIFINSLTANSVFVSHRDNPSVTYGLRTPYDSEVTRLATLAQNVGLDVELRICLFLSQSFKESYEKFASRSTIAPSDPELFFRSYGDICVAVADVSETAEIDLLTVFVEMNSMEQYADQIRGVLSRIDEVYSGQLAVDQATHHFLRGFSPYGYDVSAMESITRSTFWDWVSDEGNPVMILMNDVDPQMASVRDARMSRQAEEFYKYWYDTVQYYREVYPGRSLGFGEIAVRARDGAAMGYQDGIETEPYDYQEVADSYYSIVAACKALGLDGYAVEYIGFLGSDWSYTLPPVAEAVLAETSLVAALPLSQSSRDLVVQLGNSPTYEEIMSVIAEYPGADEPTYLPSADEPIWLTDLEGHADIYDNDSIKINYADWFDQSQITKIEVYRNGIKLRFVPDMLNVLTNNQMKTFDGNPLEHTPASSHTDHVIWGYEYSFHFRGLPTVEILSAGIRSPVRYTAQWYNANLLSWFFRTRDANYEDSDFLEFFNQLAALGYRGVSLDVTCFMTSLTANSIFPQYKLDNGVREWLATPTDEEIRRILFLIQEAGLEAEVRMQIWLANSFTRSNDPECDRSSIRPSNVTEFFDNYTAHAVKLARLADQEGADMFVPFVEMNSLEPYVEEIHRMLDAIDAVFGGRIAIAESTNHYLSGFSCYNSETEFEVNVGKFWDWEDEHGNPLVIGMDAWTPPMDDRNDQRFSVMLSNAVDFWTTAVEYFRSQYPLNELMFTEIGAFNFDGQARGWQGDPFSLTVERDDQEFADSWAVFILLADLFGLEGMDVWTTDILIQNCANGRYYKIPSSCVLNTPAQRVITAMTLLDAQVVSGSNQIEDLDQSSRPLADSNATNGHETEAVQDPSELAEPTRTISLLGSTPQGIEIVGADAFVMDWSSGLLQFVEPATGEVSDLEQGFAHVTDIASTHDDLLIVNESGEAWIVDTESGQRSNYAIDAQFSGEVLGVEHENGVLFLLVYTGTGPMIIEVQSDQSTQTPVQVGTAGELISLQMWNGSLLTLDYGAGIGYRLIESGNSYALEQAFNITDYVPTEEQASGGVRGFFLTDDVYYFTSMSQDANPGKLHIVPVAADPLAVSLQDWVLTDFGTNSGALETVRYGEDDHGSYVAFTNPSTSLNVVLQLWSNSADHDLSSANGFFVDAVSLGEPTDVFVEFIHDDASYSEGAIFMNNEHDVFTLPESGGLTITLDDLVCSEDTAFPWSDVDGVMLHFRPSTAEVRFYGFRAAIQAAINEVEK